MRGKITQHYTNIYMLLASQRIYRHGEFWPVTRCTEIVLLIVGRINRRDGINAPTKGDPSRDRCRQKAARILKFRSVMRIYHEKIVLK